MTVQQPHLSHPKYRPDIDGLRAVAVLAVVVFHAFPSSIKGGFIGVDVFFVISGYLISTIIFESLDRGTFSFSEFYARRIKRIFPALILVLIACFAFGWFALLADEFKQLGKHIAAGAGFVSNHVLWSEVGYFDNSAETKPLLHLWSLGIEEQFYIVWPLLLWFAWKRKFNLFTITILVAIVSFMLNIKGIQQDGVATFYSPQTRFWELLCGSFLAWVTLYKTGAFASVKNKLDGWLAAIVYSEKQAVDGKTLCNLVSFIGLFLLVYGFWQINKELSFPGKWALVPVLSAVLIITAGPDAWVNRTILSNKLAIWFGLISFPLYLWHWPLLSFARIVGSEIPSPSIRITAVVLSVLFAWLTYKLIERPVRLGKHERAKVVVLVVLMAFVGGLAYYVFLFNIQSPAAKKILHNSSQLGWEIPVGNDKQIALCRSMFPDRLTISSIIRDDNFCYLQKEGTPNVLLIGDSMNLSLFPGLAGYDDMNTLMLSASLAAPFYNVRTTDIGDEIRLNNYLMTNQALDYAVTNQNIKVVVLASLALASITDPNNSIKMWDINNLERSDTHQIFLEAMSNTLQKLTLAGKRIIYVLPNPTLRYDPKSCLDNLRPITLAKNKKSCSRTLESVNSEYLIYRNWVKDVLSNFPEVVVFDPSPFFCDKNDCYGAMDGGVLYRDDNHLSINGSNLVAPQLHSLILSELNH
ncbi:MAG: acyltransferase family protein [Pseudomonadota bacterium]